MRIIVMKMKMKTHRRLREVRLAKVSALMHSILFALISSSCERYHDDYDGGGDDNDDDDKHLKGGEIL